MTHHWLICHKTTLPPCCLISRLECSLIHLTELPENLFRGSMVPFNNQFPPKCATSMKLPLIAGIPPKKTMKARLKTTNVEGCQRDMLSMLQEQKFFCQEHTTERNISYLWEKQDKTKKKKESACFQYAVVYAHRCWRQSGGTRWSGRTSNLRSGLTWQDRARGVPPRFPFPFKSSLCWLLTEIWELQVTI